MNEDELERFRRLEAEAKVIHSAKEAEKQRLREAQRKKEAEQQALLARQKALLEKRSGGRSAPSAAAPDDDDSDDDAPAPRRGRRGGLDLDLDVGTALDVARSAKGELERPRAKGEKSLLISGGVSLVLGPAGWLYAGSWRESIPAAAGWLAIAAVAGKIFPMFLLMPVLMVVMPASAIAGMLYAWQYNRKGGRTRLFKGKDDGGGSGGGGKTTKQLPAGKRRR